MSIIRIEDIAHVRFRAPDMAEMQAFLEQFGLAVVQADVLQVDDRAAGGQGFVLGRGDLDFAEGEGVFLLREGGFTAQGCDGNQQGVRC